jgi:hypothetical protein
MAPYNSVVYAGGPLGPAKIAGNIPDVHGSGVTTVVLWAIHIGSPALHPTQTLGDLIFNEQQFTFVSGGQFNTEFSAWPSQVAALRGEFSSVTKIFFSTGGGDSVRDFTTIGQIIQEQGTGPDSILYQNFKALREAFTVNGTCVIDGIDFDNEDNYDQAVVTQFAAMLFGLGFQVSFCPFCRSDFWTACMQTLWNQGHEVSAWNLQCYSGGLDNLSQIPMWIQAVATVVGPDAAASYIVPGLAVCDAAGNGQCPGPMCATIDGYRSTGVQGTFLWLYDYIPDGSCGTSVILASYVSAINSGLAGECGGEKPEPAH